MFKRLVWNPDERRLSALVRILLQLILMLFLLVFPQFFIGIILGILGFTSIPTSLLLSTILSIFTVLAMVGSVFLAGFVFDRRKLRDFGFVMNKSWWRDFGFGLFLGAFLMVIIFGVEYALGFVEVKDYFAISNPNYPFLLLILFQVMNFTFVGIQEEVLSRGYHLKNLSEGLNNLKRISPKTAVILSTVISSAVFGLMHITNPNASLISSFNIFIAGFMLAAGFLLTKQLAIPIGLHISWNFFQGNVFGFPVSGTNSNSTSFLAIRQSGPEWFTGGAFGPEAGAIGLVMMFAGLGLIWLYSNKVCGARKVQAGLAIPEFLLAHQEKIDSYLVMNGELVKEAEETDTPVDGKVTDSVDLEE